MSRFSSRYFLTRLRNGEGLTMTSVEVQPYPRRPSTMVRAPTPSNAWERSYSLGRQAFLYSRTRVMSSSFALSQLRQELDVNNWEQSWISQRLTLKPRHVPSQEENRGLLSLAVERSSYSSFDHFSILVSISCCPRKTSPRLPSFDGDPAVDPIQLPTP